MQDSEIEIIAEEPHFLLVNKPAGLFAQAAPGVPSLELQLAKQLKERDQHPGNPFIGLPHRLDRATSGVMLIARNRRALAKFGEQFQSRKIHKFYVAVLEGELQASAELWEDYVRKIPDQPKAEVVESTTELAKKAELRITTLACNNGRTLAIVQLLTGRMHQIRIQAAQRGFPVVDDALYGSETQALTKVHEEASGNELPRELPPGEDLAAARERPHALHALRLEFRHPQTAKPFFATAGLPSYWQTFSQQLGSSLESLVSQSRQSIGSWDGLHGALAVDLPSNDQPENKPVC